MYDELKQTVTLHKKLFSPDLVPTDDGQEQIFSGSNQPLLAELEHFIHCIQTRETPMSGSLNSSL